MLTIFGLTVNKGDKVKTRVPVGQLACGSKVDIPVLILSGEQSGPTLWINGTVHGDELNGPVASWELFNEIDVKDIKGNIIITPISNPLAFQSRNKISSIDSLDMDTTFPGDSSGLFTQRIAKIIFSEIKANANYLISLHTLGSYYAAVPYTVSKIVPNAEKDIIDISYEMALSFGLKTNCVVNLQNAGGELPGVTSGALDITCIQNGIPSFMAEVGGGGRLERENIDIAKQGLLNLMSYLKMVEKEIQLPESQYVITKRYFYRTDFGGIINVSAEPGSIISRNDEIANVHYFGDEKHSLTPGHDAYVIGVRVNPVVNTGDRVAFIGTEWHIVNNK